MAKIPILCCNRLLRPAAFLLVLFAVTACSKNNEEQATETVAEDVTNRYDDDLSPLLDDAVSAKLATSVRLPGARTPLQVYTRQLTDRAAEEQIVISRHPDFGNLELFLISPRVVSSIEGSVADYRIVAQEELRIDSETFTVQTQDLTGDGTTQEIFVAGENTANGLQQAYVFQLLVSGAEKNVIGLNTIFYQQDSGSYEISYDDNGYYIVLQRLLDQSSYQLELTDLSWNPASRSFVVQNVEIIDNSTKLPDNLKAIYQGSAEDFFAAVDGLWVRGGSPNKLAASAPQNRREAANDQIFLYFDSEAGELLVYGDVIGLQKNDQIIEVYNIFSMIKSLWNRLNLNVRNKYVYNIQSYFYVTLEDHNTIKLFVSDSVTYMGTYKRVDAYNYETYRDDSLKRIGPANFQLEGAFTERSEDKRYVFQPDKMTVNEANGKVWEGSYSLFSWDDNNYLEFHLSEITSFEESRRTYRVELSSDEEGSDTPREGLSTSDISVLLLYPVRLLQVEEINSTSESIIRLEREQKIDSRELEDLLPGR
ncbi:hypothetical protein P0082_03690 [Candidatus Haliotispira prima]|uniref:Pallilysin beta barrel domain-containing protein n=1 Tax=Candidatus Haliotispira prima TaxID=3034016 RepID=A0ABY8MJJ0_9SPIO|nr:hypothetical protein P0082_03690 [Candidatus Haliotispira prima]